MATILVFILVILFVVIFKFSTSLPSSSSSPSSIQKKTPITNNIINNNINDNQPIPYNIFQTWHNTDNLPPNMQACVDLVKKTNPEFQHFLFDDDDCRQFIAQHFDADVVDAYECLNPGAYKADLWRYCVLYIKGGVYMDIKLCPIRGFPLKQLMHKEHFVLDRPLPLPSPSDPTKADLELINGRNEDTTGYSGYLERLAALRQKYNRMGASFWKNEDDHFGLYNAFMICRAGNPLLLDCIQSIVRNVRNRFYGHNSLYPTGPGLLGELYFRGDLSQIENIDIFHSVYNSDLVHREYGAIFTPYPEYRQEQKWHSNGTPHYSTCWKRRTVYKSSAASSAASSSAHEFLKITTSLSSFFSSLFA